MNEPTPSATDPASAPAPVAKPAPKVEILADDQYSQYLLHSKSEIAAVLKGLVDHVAQITMTFNEGRDMVLTSLVSYDDDDVVLDYGASSEMNRRALEAEKLFCVSQIDKVKIQFLLRGLFKTEADGRPAFSARRPDNVLRLQRREYFRLSTPIARPIKCLIPVVLPTGAKQMADAVIVDISGGGMGLLNPPAMVPFETGMEFPGCRFDLPEVGTVTATLVVRSVYETTTRSGGKNRRAGCEFKNLPGPMMTLIQRYIIKMERERKARESGMG